MIILTLRTDKPEAEIGLFDNGSQLAYQTWEAHRRLAETLHAKIEALLNSQQMNWHDIGGIVCFAGPGSFTGLRIGLTVGNTLAYGLQVPIVATKNAGWITVDIQKLQTGQADPLALPDYGAPAHITQQKK